MTWAQFLLSCLPPSQKLSEFKVNTCKQKQLKLEKKETMTVLFLIPRQKSRIEEMRVLPSRLNDDLWATKLSSLQEWLTFQSIKEFKFNPVLAMMGSIA